MWNYSMFASRPLGVRELRRILLPPRARAGTHRMIPLDGYMIIIMFNSLVNFLTQVISIRRAYPWLPDGSDDGSSEREAG